MYEIVFNHFIEILKRSVFNIIQAGGRQFAKQPDKFVAIIICVKSSLGVKHYSGNSSFITQNTSDKVAVRK